MQRPDLDAPKGPGIAPARAWFLVFVMFLMFVGAQIDRQIMAMVAQQMKHDLQLSDEQLGLLMGLAFSLTYAVSAIFTGDLADRMSRKKLLRYGLVIWSLLTCVCGVARNFPLLFLARLGVGFGESVLSPTALPLVAAAFPEGKRSFPVAFTVAGSAVGLIVTPIFIGFILDATAGRSFGPFPVIGSFHGWQLAFLVAGAFGFLTLLLLPFVQEPSRYPSSERRSGLAASLGHFGDYGKFYAAALLTVPVAVASNYALISWMPAYMARTFDLSPTQVGLYNGIAFIPAAVVSPLIAGFLGRKADASRSARQHFVIMLWLLPMLGALVALPLFAPTPELCAAAFTVAMTWTNVVMLFGFIIVQQVVPNAYRSLGTAVVFSGNVLIGAGLGPVVVGALATRVFGEEALGSALLVCIGGSLPLAVLFAALGAITRRLPPGSPGADTGGDRRGAQASQAR